MEQGMFAMRKRGTREREDGGLTKSPNRFACSIAAYLLFANFVSSNSPAGHRFVLVKTDGNPVCGTFLRLLNSTKFLQPPICGIPSAAPVPGVSFIEKTLLSEEQAEKLFSRVYGFTTFHDQSTVTATPPSYVIRSGYGSNIFAWKYSAISPSNDGSKEDMLIWQGKGGDDY